MLYTNGYCLIILYNMVSYIRQYHELTVSAHLIIGASSLNRAFSCHVERTVPLMTRLTAFNHALSLFACIIFKKGNPSLIRAYPISVHSTSQSNKKGDQHTCALKQTANEAQCTKKCLATPPPLISRGCPGADPASWIQASWPGSGRPWRPRTRRRRTHRPEDGGRRCPTWSRPPWPSGPAVVGAAPTRTFGRPGAWPA